jgi:hypothetical protein
MDFSFWSSFDKLGGALRFHLHVLSYQAIHGIVDRFVKWQFDIENFQFEKQVTASIFFKNSDSH